MTYRNETASNSCCFLNDEYFERLYYAFIEAFSDYVIRFALTEAQFRKHIILNAVDLNRSVAHFDDQGIVGFSLNGFGDWQGRPTVYDAGTGVVPSHRRQGISERMFELMVPVFAAEGIEQFLLEVVTTNTAAINLYKKMNFEAVRELLLLQCDVKIHVEHVPKDEIEIRSLVDLDWERMITFWDGDPSWQNSIEAIGRSHQVKRTLGAFVDGDLAGYIVFSSTFGRVAQIAVDKQKRNRGIGTALVLAMQAETADGFSLQVINLDRSITSATEFFAKKGFQELLSQYEMNKTF